MTVETIFRTTFFQIRVSEFSVKHIEDGAVVLSMCCEKQVFSTSQSVSKAIKCYM